MSHDRGCHCGKEKWEYNECTRELCSKRSDPTPEAVQFPAKQPRIAVKPHKSTLQVARENAVNSLEHYLEACQDNENHFESYGECNSQGAFKLTIRAELALEQLLKA